MSPTTVTVGLAAVRNLGNYENLKIEVSVQTETLPNDPKTGKPETASAAIDRVYALVEKKLDEKLLEALGQNGE